MFSKFRMEVFNINFKGVTNNCTQYGMGSMPEIS